jgi:transposase
MTLHPREIGDVPADTAAVAAHVLGEGDPYRVLGDQLADVLSDEQFARLYDEVGRPAVSPSLLALVTLFQFLEDVPDREAARLVRLRIDWKYALHLGLTDPGFHYADLCHFRRRLIEHEAERLVFETILAKIRALGLIKKRGKQRTDALAVLGAVRELSALETVSEALRLALRALGEAAPAWLAGTVPEEFREARERSQPTYRLTPAERTAALVEWGTAARWLLDRLATAPPDLALGALPEVDVLATIWAQRYEQVSGEVRVRERGVPCPERVVTPHDPGVRAGEKRGKGWHGEKVHVTETAEPGGPNFLVDIATENASSGDGEALPGIWDRLDAQDLLPAEQGVDAGYGAGKYLAEATARGIELIGPPLEDTSPQAFKIADFQIDEERQEAICPTGRRAVKWSPRTERDGSRAVNIQFAAADCAACPWRDNCTTSRTGRSLHLSEYYPLVAARRAEAATPAFREKMRIRPAIEGTLSELVRVHGFRRHRYRGDRKRHCENLLKAAACNLKRLARVLAARAAGTPAARTAGAALP